MFILSAYAFEYDSLPLVIVKEIPSQLDFADKTQQELVGNAWHSTILRDNGEKVESYFLQEYSSTGDFVAIFYFEDSTDDDFKEDYYYKTDLFVFDILKDDATRLTAVVERTGAECVKDDSGVSGFYSLTGNCSVGSIITKKTDNGWAAYIKFFKDFEKPKADE